MTEQSADVLTRLVALSPTGLRDVNATVRAVCADAVGLPPLPAEPATGAVDPVVAEFAEQFSTDVSSVDADLRGRFLGSAGTQAFSVTALIFIADFVPRVRAGLAALGLGRPADEAASVDWDRDGEPGDVLLNDFAPTVGRMRDLDPVTSEIVRLRGARQHNCRLCKSLREGAALDAGGSESLYSGIDSYEASDLGERHKAALRYVDALIWQPSALGAAAAGVREQFSDAEAAELTLDVMRNACNKIAVAFGADQPRIAEGTERYLLGADGHPVYS